MTSAARERGLPPGHQLSADRCSRSASLGDALGGARDRRAGGPVARPARACCARRRRDVGADALVVSATKGLEEALAAADVRGGRRRSAARRRRSPCSRVRASRRSSRASCRRRSSSRRRRAARSEHVQEEFRSDALRLYGSTDVVGVEIGGALKNIIAIAAGRRRRPRPRPQRARRADHARARRDHAAGGGARRAARNARRAWPGSAISC